MTNTSASERDFFFFFRWVLKRRDQGTTTAKSCCCCCFIFPSRCVELFSTSVTPKRAGSFSLIALAPTSYCPARLAQPFQFLFVLERAEEEEKKRDTRPDYKSSPRPIYRPSRIKTKERLAIKIQSNMAIVAINGPGSLLKHRCLT